MLERILEPEVMDTAEESQAYDEMDHSTVNRQFTEDLLRAAGEAAAGDSLPARLTVLDVGTGTALIPIELCRQAPAVVVTAVDASAEMLRLAERNIAAAHLADRIQPLRCDARTIPVPAARFDLVISNSIIHHLADPLPVVREMVRVLKPGGLLFLRDLLRPASLTELKQLVATYAGEESDHARQLFHDSLHASLTCAEVEQILSAAGCQSAEVRPTSDRHWTASYRSPSR
ncbi:MAG: class I SAM-dependent methyltransferase [Planctomycetaceae bacterium]|nr:class I SAM-dependent methyltransferase [Planctomycetaceae bacterium]